MICIALWIMIVVIADVSKVPFQRKIRVFKFLTDQFLYQVEDWKNNRSGFFCLHNLKYTNVFSLFLSYIGLLLSGYFPPYLLFQSSFPSHSEHFAVRNHTTSVQTGNLSSKQYLRRSVVGDESGHQT